MAKKKECTICKHYGDKTDDPDKLERAQLFDENGNPVPVQLCRSHNVELFQMGQKKFLCSHYRILVDLIDSDEPKFLAVLEQVIQANPDLVKSIRK